MTPTRTDKILTALGLTIARRRGRRGWMACPFHEQKVTTTFFVRLEGEHAGTFHCFSCKARGNLPALVSKVRGCDLDEARRFIYDSGRGHEAPRRRVRIVDRPGILGRRRFVFPKQVVLRSLDEWDDLPRIYAIDRGITKEEVALYGLGYAVDGELAGRIVFPVRVAPDARIVGYSARTFVDEDPKYKTPAEGDAADFDAIFGEHLWPSPPDRREIVITEGAIDKLAVTRVSGVCSGSIGGSDVQSGHALTLATFKHVIIMTDPDPPGDKAAQVLVGLIGRYALTTRARLPEGTDAAKLAKKDPDRLRREIHRALKRGTS